MKKTEIIAIYLPQFHRIPENDMWWGEGFTEWTNVKKADPLFEGHLQPRIPLDGDYYDLSDKDVLLRQMRLARDYGIDGFCFYHYWFKGRKLLEKPIEAILNEDRLPIKFMLSWANEPWTRTWDGNRGAQTILVDQDYGDESDWIEHYKYWSQFFKREEYIKVDGRPVLAVYNPASVPNKRDMFALWNKCATSDGFMNGLFIINTHRLPLDRELPFYGDAVFDFEPLISVSERFNYLKRLKACNKRQGCRCDNADYSYDVIDYGELCKIMTDRYAFSNIRHYLGFFFGWDNTPRRGIETKLIIDGNTPEIAEKFFDIQYGRSVKANNDFIFINAWNEWGEGAFIEPDEEYGFGYLESIKRVKDKYLAFIEERCYV